jgi:hypothetical protein
MESVLPVSVVLVYLDNLNNPQNIHGTPVMDVKNIKLSGWYSVSIASGAE